MQTLHENKIIRGYFRVTQGIVDLALHPFGYEGYDRIAVSWQPPNRPAFDRRGPLTAERWRPHQGAEIEGALAALLRIQMYWSASLQHHELLIIRDDDAGLYATLHHDLLFMLHQRPELRRARNLMKKLVPSTPPTYGDAPWFREDTSTALFDNFTRARRELERLGVAEGRSPGKPHQVRDLFSWFDDELIFFRQSAREQGDSVEEQLRQVEAESSTANLPSGPPMESKAGRKRIDIPFETAQQAYWDVADALEDAGENRSPSQQDVVDKLAMSGNKVSKSKFGDLVRDWRKVGKNWPPPRLETDS